MSRPPSRGRLKANAVALARLIHSPSTRKDTFRPPCHEEDPRSLRHPRRIFPLLARDAGFHPEGQRYRSKSQPHFGVSRPCYLRRLYGHWKQLRAKFHACGHVHLTSKMKPWVSTLLAAAVIVALFYYWENRRGQPQPKPDGKPAATTSEPIPTGNLAAELTSRLIASDWPDASARAVVALNLDRYAWLRQTAEGVIEREFQALGALHPEGTVPRLLEKHPEMAGALLIARNHDDVAAGILNCEEEEDRVRLIGSFVKYTEADEMTLWASAVARHGRCIAGLLRRCQAWPVDALFVFPTSDPAVAQEYGHWLDDVFDPSAVPASDDETLSLIEFVLSAGPEIRKRMHDDPHFRETFRSVIWPSFSRCVLRSCEELKSRAAWDLFASDPSIWDVLKRPDGEALFQRAGMLAGDLLYGQDAVLPVLPELREKAAQLLLLGNQELVAKAFGGTWSRHPQFRRLMLERHLTDDQILAACDKLAADKDPNKILAGWNSMTDQALSEDIGPPPGGLKVLIPGFSVYYAAKKLAQGRSLGWADTIGVAGDVATLLSLGTSEILTEGGKVATTVAVRQTLRREAVEDTAKLASRELAEQAAEKQLTSMVVHHALQRLPAEIRLALLKAAVIDVTDIVKSSYSIMKGLGIGRESFKKFVGLEARIFMRGNARVLVSLPSALAGNNPCAKYLCMTAVNGAFDTVLRAPATRDAALTTGNAIRVAADESTRCQQNLACWWSGLATHAFDKPADTK